MIEIFRQGASESFCELCKCMSLNYKRILQDGSHGPVNVAELSDVLSGIVLSKKMGYERNVAKSDVPYDSYWF